MNAQRPIHVMHIIARLNVGGPAVLVTLLAAHLHPPEFESTLVCGQIGPHEGDMAYVAEAYGITPLVVAELGRELSPLRDIVTLLKLWRLMRRLRPDVVHTHTAKAGFVGRWAAWLARVPVRVHTFHGHILHGYFGPRKTAFFRWLEWLTACLSNCLIAISPAQRDELSRDLSHRPRREVRRCSVWAGPGAVQQRAAPRRGLPRRVEHPARRAAGGHCRAAGADQKPRPVPGSSPSGARANARRPLRHHRRWGAARGA
ncbi:MAG: glycosyltransferase [Anaerolineae bacterium]|nr:glycosyltransferase [Anaerolineae bacterium]